MLRGPLLAVVLLTFCRPAFAELKLHDVKARHGQLGPQRQSLKVAPGDEVVFSFVLDGFQTSGDGKVDCELLQKITSPDGRELSSKVPIKDNPAFAGNRMPGYAVLNLPFVTPPGDYQLHITVTDKIGNASASFERTVTVMEPALALIRPRFSYEAEGKIPAGLTAVVGTRLHWRAFAVGFDRAQQKMDVVLTMQLHDGAGAPLMPRPVTIHATNANADQVAKTDFVNFSAFFTCNRPGTFRVSITLTDRIAEKSVTFDAPVTVVD
jgi:hypothetical protein